MRPEADTEDTGRKITRPVVSDMDGTREGGLVFCICLILGMIGAGAISGAALASFWVWVGLLVASGGVAVNVQRLVARWSGFKETE